MQNRVFLIGILFILFFSNCKKNNIQTISDEEKPLQALNIHPLDFPLKTDKSFLILNTDYSIIKIDENGAKYVLNNLSNYFPAPSDLNTHYNYIHFRFSPDRSEIWLNAVVENISNDDYYYARLLKLDTLGNVRSNLTINFPAADTTTINDFFDFSIINGNFYYLFSAKQKSHLNVVNLRALRYNLQEDSVYEKNIEVTHRGDLLTVVNYNNLLHLFYFSNNTVRNPMVSSIRLNDTLAVLDTISYNLIADNFYYIKQKTNGRYFIEGGNSGLGNETTQAYDFMAEIDLNGTVFSNRRINISNTKFESGYYYINDIIELPDSLMSCGYYSTDWGYFSIKNYTSAPSRPFSYIIAYSNASTDYLAYGTYSIEGFSSMLAINKASYGYLALGYYNEFGASADQNTLWLFKLNNELKLISN